MPRVGRADMDAVQTCQGRLRAGEGRRGEGIWKEEFWWEGT